MTTLYPGTVVKLDRGFPLVRLNEGKGGESSLVRCEHATTLIKGTRRKAGGSKALRAAIGDQVQVEVPESHDKGIICAIEERRSAFVRKDPAERTAKQVLAANFDTVMVVEPLTDLNRRRLERELVLAHDTKATVAVVLTKADLVLGEEAQRTCSEVRALAGSNVPVLACRLDSTEAVEAVRALVPPGQTAILIGKSGVGKSSLVNALAGVPKRATSEVRDADGKGRHTTVDRALVDIPGGGAVVDMPGVRGLGLWDIGQGLASAFADVEGFSERCRFRDCTHANEPGCAVRKAVESGQLAAERLRSYQSLAAEIAQVREKREEARRMRGEKASNRKGAKFR